MRWINWDVDNSWDQGQERDPAAIGFDNGALGNGLAMRRGIVGAFAMHVGLDLFEQPRRDQVVKEEDMIDALQGGEDLRPLRLPGEWAEQDF